MITVVNNQSLIDIAIQEDGSALAVIDWSDANNIAVTAQLVAGQKLVRPQSNYRDNEIANYFKGKSKLVATDYIEVVSEIVYGFPEIFPIIF